MAKPAKKAIKTDYETLTGAERAAVLMLALGDEHGAGIWSSLDDDEVKEISQTMANLGTVSSSSSWPRCHRPVRSSAPSIRPSAC